MKLLLFLAADYANIATGDKVNVMGIFREISASTFPARHPSMYLVIKFLAELGEDGDTPTLTVKLLDPDGNQLMSLSGTMAIPKRQGGRTPEVNAILELRDIIFPKPGPYQFVVFIDKDHKGELPIFLNQTEASNAIQS